MEDIIIFLGIAFNLNLPLLTAWLLDHWLGDPVWLPHPVVAFGKTISFCEHRLNKGNARFLKGAVMSLVLVAGVYLLTLFLLRWAAHYSPGLLLTLQVLHGDDYRVRISLNRIIINQQQSLEKLALNDTPKVSV